MEMNRKATALNWIIGTMLFLLLVGGAVAFAHGYGRNRDESYGPVVEPLPQEVKLALLGVLDAEYVAYAVYDAVISKYGELEPYFTLRGVEVRHIEALKKLLQRYGIGYPAENPHLGAATSSGTLEEAAAMLARKTTERVAIYEEALEKAENYPDIAHVLLILERVSLKAHLPALGFAAKSGGALNSDQMARLGFERGHGPFGMRADGDEYCPMEHGMMWSGRGGERGFSGWMDCHGDD